MDRDSLIVDVMMMLMTDGRSVFPLSVGLSVGMLSPFLSSLSLTP
jgi:hypothetical protein